MSTYRISQLADRCGVPATTLRFYEDAGLLPAERTPSGYRVYGEDAVERLGFISSAKLLGLALEEIRELLEVREEGVCAAVRTRMVPLVAGRIEETEGRIAELSAFSAHLAAVHADLSGPAPEGGCGPDCGCTTTPAAAGPVPVTLSRTRLAAPVAAAESWREAPVACTLGGPELEGRTQEWRQLVEQAETREEIPDGLRLTFPATAELAGRLAALAAAEQGCCAFFDFTLHLTPAALELTARARSRSPAAGQPVRSDRMSHPASSSSRRPRPWGTVGAGIAAAACAVCCAGPLLALLGGIGAASVLASFWVPALAVVAGAAAVGAYVLHRRRRAAACDTTTGPVDLGLPAVGPARDTEHTR